MIFSTWFHTVLHTTHILQAFATIGLPISNIMSKRADHMVPFPNHSGEAQTTCSYHASLPCVIILGDTPMKDVHADPYLGSSILRARPRAHTTEIAHVTS